MIDPMNRNVAAKRVTIRVDHRRARSARLGRAADERLSSVARSPSPPPAVARLAPRFGGTITHLPAPLCHEVGRPHRNP